MTDGVPVAEAGDGEGAAVQLLELLENETYSLSFSWKFYRELYCDESTIARINASAPMGFRMIQEAFIHNFIRVICALCDPVGKGKKQNLTLRRVAVVVLWESRVHRKESAVKALPVVKESLATLEALCDEVFRPHRNKRLMHFDLGNAMVKNDGLPKLVADHLDLAIDLVFKIASALSVCAKDGHVVYDRPIDNSGSRFKSILRNHMVLDATRRLARAGSIQPDRIADIVRYPWRKHPELD